MPRPKPAWHSQALALVETGLTTRQIAAEVGRTQGAVYKALHPEKASAWNKGYNAQPVRREAKREESRARRERVRATRESKSDSDPMIPGLIPVWTPRRANNPKRIIDFARVDLADWDQLQSFHFTFTAGYAATQIDSRMVYLHHLLIGPVQRGSGEQTDHINRDKLDNRRQNLRRVATIENQHNRGGKFERCWGRLLAA